MLTTRLGTFHNDVVNWKHFPRYRWIPLTKTSDAELWCFCFFICAWIDGWANNPEVGDLRRHHTHYDVILMTVGINAAIIFLIHKIHFSAIRRLLPHRQATSFSFCRSIYPWNTKTISLSCFIKSNFGLNLTSVRWKIEINVCSHSGFRFFVWIDVTLFISDQTQPAVMQRVFSDSIDHKRSTSVQTANIDFAHSCKIRCSL